MVGRAALAGGRDGPLIVEEYDATCVVPPGAHAALDDDGCIVLDAGGMADGHRSRGRDRSGDENTIDSSG